MTEQQTRCSDARYNCFGSEADTNQFGDVSGCGFHYFSIVYTPENFRARAVRKIHPADSAHGLKAYRRVNFRCYMGCIESWFTSAQKGTQARNENFLKNVF
jgi:hypothetical protein